MPKIKIEIDATSEEIIEIFRGLAAKKSDFRKSAYGRYFKNKDARNPYEVVEETNFKKPTPVKKAKKSPIKKGLKKKVKNPRGKHARKGGWTQLEVAWLQDWISTKPVNKETVKAFRKKFGYVRSFSSLSNKAFALRKK